MKAREAAGELVASSQMGGGQTSVRKAVYLLYNSQKYTLVLATAADGRVARAPRRPKPKAKPSFGRGARANLSDQDGPRHALVTKSCFFSVTNIVAAQTHRKAIAWATATFTTSLILPPRAQLTRPGLSAEERWTTEGGGEPARRVGRGRSASLWPLSVVPVVVLVSLPGKSSSLERTLLFVTRETSRETEGAESSRASQKMLQKC